MPKPYTIHLGNGKTVMVKELRIRNECDLRASLEEKEAVASSGWEAFVNKRGSLVHIVHGTSGVLVRVAAKGGEVFKNPDYTFKAIAARHDALAQLARILR